MLLIRRKENNNLLGLFNVFQDFLNIEKILVKYLILHLTLNVLNWATEAHAHEI